VAQLTREPKPLRATRQRALVDGPRARDFVRRDRLPCAHERG
jgi:hypothetical protein